MQLANPWVLALCVLIPPLVYLTGKLGTRTQSSFRFSNQDLVRDLKPSLRAVLSRNLIYLRAVSLFLLILAAARPQSAIEETKIHVEGIDIVLAVDSSGSMRAMDFEMRGKRVDRLVAVKDVVSKFIEKRPNDRIGMVAFAALAYTVCPLTLDHDWLEKNLERVRIGMIKDGTAIGSAISAALNRIKDTEAKGKIIILLTDGRNNAGRISPMAAAEAAAALGVRIYTIGAGTKGLAPFPVPDMFGNTVLRPVQIEIDEGLLRKIAETTGGAYFRATDTGSLKEIYGRIDELEKTSMEETGYNIYRELFAFVLIPGLALLVLEVILSNTLLRRIP
ncbi:MAG: aerotolerance regulator BatA [Candidatus Makaraimicrobium thalassicum]|nr:MAG: aerotolerance regulator BatA [Candidatus Omnitrophota bacterium]